MIIGIRGATTSAMTSAGYGVVATNVATGGVSGLTSGVMNEGFAERLDDDPWNDDVSMGDIAAETVASLTFGGSSSMMPYADEVLDLGTPPQTLQDWEDTVAVAGGLWFESANELAGD